jgi:hypothetical protein
MLRQLLRRDIQALSELLVSDEWVSGNSELNLVGVASELYKLLLKTSAHHPDYLSRLAVAHHLNGELRTAGRYYESVLEVRPQKEVSEAEAASILRYAPVLHVNPQECFPLMDVVAIHHPEQPLIGYHLFWEDDYDFPDDYEPCDHEVVWVTYDTQRAVVQNIQCFFHSYVLSTSEAVETANQNDGRPTVYVEWGKHGSLIDGWEQAQDGQRRYFARDMMKKDYDEVSQGGRLPSHPLKRWWPEKFEGEYTDYLNFDKIVDTRDYLTKKRMMAKTSDSNAVLQQHFLLYNFHPKYDWPAQVLE